MNLNEALRRGTRAAQPAANDVGNGTLYFVTDESVTEQALGAAGSRAWVDYSDSGGAGITELTGNITAGPGSGSVAATIASDAVTYAKMQNVSAASRIIGRGSAGGAGDPQELTVGSGLAIAGTVINATGGGATLVYVAGATAGHNPADTTTYAFGVFPNVNPTPSADSEWNAIMPRNGTVARAFVRARVFGTLGSTQTVTFKVRNKTAGTEENITTTMQFSSATNLANNVAMTLAFSAGDEIQAMFVTPTWTTNPLIVFYETTIEVIYSQENQWPE